MSYDHRAKNEDDVYTVEEFLERVKLGLLIDYDGFGHPAQGRMLDRTIMVRPSNCLLTIPKDATHIVWYNR